MTQSKRVFGFRALALNVFLLTAAPATFAFCDGDANGDGVVNSDDVSYVLFRLGQSNGICGAGDPNGNGINDSDDIAYVLFRLGSCDNEGNCQNCGGPTHIGNFNVVQQNDNPFPGPDPVEFFGVGEPVEPPAACSGTYGLYDSFTGNNPLTFEVDIELCDLVPPPSGDGLDEIYRNRSRVAILEYPISIGIPTDITDISLTFTLAIDTTLDGEIIYVEPYVGWTNDTDPLNVVVEWEPMQRGAGPGPVEVFSSSNVFDSEWVYDFATDSWSGTDSLVTDAAAGGWTQSWGPLGPAFHPGFDLDDIQSINEGDLYIWFRAYPARRDYSPADGESITATFDLTITYDSPSCGPSMIRFGL